MGRSIRVMIVENRRDTRELIKRYLKIEKLIEVIGEADTGPEAVKQAEKLNPDIVLMYADMRGMDGYEACEKIMASGKNVSVILMSRDNCVEDIRRAMVSGAKDFITVPYEPNELINTIRLAYKKRIIFKSESENGHQLQSDGQVISVFSTKGGVGKTTIAFNLAVDIAGKSKKKVALVDMDLQFGDIALMADIEPERTIADIMEESGGIDTAVLKDFMTPYTPDLMILASPPGPEYADYINGDSIKEILGFLKKSFDYIIVDTASNFSEVTLSILDVSDTILMVAAMDIVSAKNVKIGLGIMKSLEYSDDKVKILVNMANPKLGISYGDMERIFERRIDYRIPDDKKNLVKAMNKGYPYVSRRGAGKTSKAFRKTTKSILGK